MFGGKFDIRILHDSKQFQEMDVSWRYKGEYQFLDLDQDDREVFYLSQKTAERIDDPKADHYSGVGGTCASTGHRYIRFSDVKLMEGVKDHITNAKVCAICSIIGSSCRLRCRQRIASSDVRIATVVDISSGVGGTSGTDSAYWGRKACENT